MFKSSHSETNYIKIRMYLLKFELTELDSVTVLLENENEEESLFHDFCLSEIVNNMSLYKTLCMEIIQIPANYSCIVFA